MKKTLSFNLRPLLVAMVLLLSLLATAQITPTGDIVYVTPDGTGNGSSWNSPTSDLQGAINATGVTQVFVAKGTYPSPNRGFRMKNNVAIYGGFDPDAGITQLIHNRIMPNPANTQGSVLTGENDRRVINNLFTVPGALNNTAILDGFTIMDGNASSGAGIYDDHSSPAYNNLVVRNNSATHYGGGVYLATYNINPVFTNVVIVNNTAGSNGGGVAFYGDEYSTPVFINATIAENSSPAGAGVYHQNDGTGVCHLYNSIIWGNTGGADIQKSGGGGASFAVKNSITQSYNTGNAADNNLVGTDPQFIDAANGNYALKTNSSAINKGSNALHTGLNANTNDLAGNARVYNYANAGVVDMGAYESPYTPVVPASGIVYVRPTALGKQDGSSWNDATGNLQDAIDATGVQKVFVAVGNYPVGDHSFIMKNGVEIYGGFDPDNNIKTLADARILPSVTLSEVEGSVLNGQNIRPVIWNVFTSSTSMDNTAVLDGFTLTNGSYSSGAGIRNVYASPTLRNLAVSNNYASVSGGGIYNDNSSPLISNAVIKDNTAETQGGGMFNTDASPVLTDVLINGNKTMSASQFGGGGIYNQRSKPVMNNVSITGNMAGTAGGGIYNILQSDITINGGSITGNTAQYGGGVYNNGSASVLSNVSITGNTAMLATTGAGGGGIFNQNAALVLTNVLIADNSTNFQGGGFRNLSGSPVLTNVTIANNTAGVNYSAIDIAGGTPQLNNSIVYGTTNGAYTAQYSLIEDNVDFTKGNTDATGITVTDIFTDAANGEYTLSENSPAIDAGSNALFAGLNANTKDLAGNPRVYNSGIIDLGAYEYQDLITSVAEQNNKSLNIQIYPNPASEQITISDLTGNEIITIYDQRGTAVIRQKSGDSQALIHLGTMSGGVYHISVVSDNGMSASQKLIIVK